MLWLHGVSVGKKAKRVREVCFLSERTGAVPLGAVPEIAMVSETAHAADSSPRGDERAVVPPRERSAVAVIVHSFFVVPLLIAVVSVLLFLGFRLLTAEHKDPFDYLGDIKSGGMSRRWQSAFELAALLRPGGALGQDARFNAELASVFAQSAHDPSPQVGQYLAVAMGRTGNTRHVAPLLAALAEDSDETKAYIIHALGLLGDQRAVPALIAYLRSGDERVRLQAAMALGSLGDPSGIAPLRQTLRDPQPNVRWDSAIALAKLGSSEGKPVLLELLDRDYYAAFSEVDAYEQSRALETAIHAAAMLHDSDLDAAIRRLAEGDPNMRVRRVAAAALE